MLEKASIRTMQDMIEINPQLLFQSLLTAGINSREIKNVLTYELCSYPPAFIFTHLTCFPLRKKIF